MIICSSTVPLLKTKCQMTYNGAMSTQLDFLGQHLKEFYALQEAARRSAKGNRIGSRQSAARGTLHARVDSPCAGTVPFQDDSEKAFRSLILCQLPSQELHRQTCEKNKDQAKQYDNKVRTIYMSGS